MSDWKPDKCIIFQRKNVLISELDPLMDICWEDALGEPTECVSVESNDPLYILYTSGTTDKPVKLNFFAKILILKSLL
jgi:propionyl-CoA synthetase